MSGSNTHKAITLDGAISIRTETAPDGKWLAIDADNYDGAPDAGKAGLIGWGATEQDAIEDLLEQLND